jgi:GntR family transcriptional regulator
MIVAVSWDDRSSRIDPFSGVHVWRQVASDIEADITASRLRPGDKLPAEQELAELYGVARTTVRRAMDDLRTRGLVVTAHGRGTFIKPAS